MKQTNGHLFEWSFMSLIGGRCKAQFLCVHFAQPMALGRKINDERTVSRCAPHHMKLHQTGDERHWWTSHKLDPQKEAAEFWQKTLRKNLCI